MIFLFILSLLFLGLVKLTKNITILGPFGFFVAYQIIYNLTPWVAFQFGVHLFSLSGEEDLLMIQLALASLSNFIFGLCYYYFWIPTTSPKPPHRTYRVSPQLAFWLAYFPTLFMVSRFGWNAFSSSVASGGSPSGLFSIASFMKLFLVALFIHCLILQRFARKNLIILFSLIFLLFIDGARTNFMMVISLCFFYIYDGGQRKLNWRHATMAVAAIGVLVFSRSLRLQNDFANNILDTFLAEGVIGSYMNLQTIHILKDIPGIPLTLGQNYLIDPLLSLTPLYSTLGGSMEKWITLISPHLMELYAPVGGFYYMAETLTAFGWFGPPLVTAAYAIITIHLNNKIKSNQAIYLVYLCTFGCLFSKFQFLVCFKMFAIIAFSFFMLQKFLTKPKEASTPTKEPV
jgi:hypothetical protein